MVDAKILLHCAILNSEEHMKLIQKTNEIAAVMVNLENNPREKQELNQKGKEKQAASKRKEKGSIRKGKR